MYILVLYDIRLVSPNYEFSIPPKDIGANAIVMTSVNYSLEKASIDEVSRLKSG